jgi:hypothetical protein
MRVKTKRQLPNTGDGTGRDDGSNPVIERTHAGDSSERADF